MALRVNLQTLLESILESDRVFFQPPANVQMQYPAIVYNLDDISTKFADDLPYRLLKRYQVTVIDRNPDSDIPNQIAALPMCSFSRFFVADNLNHFVFTLYH
jgi:hypothetical protein